MAIETRLERRHVLRDVLANRAPGLLVVTGLGSPGYDVTSCGDDDRNFYLWGAMGAAALIGLGLALAQPQHRVLVITGDGEMLMGLGGLATIGLKQPANLGIIVLDNEHYGETGMQASHTGSGVDLAGVAQSCGFRTALRVSTAAQVAELRDQVAGEGMFFACVKVAAGEDRRVLPPRDGGFLQQRFRRKLGVATELEVI